ncbi:hypothetical protein Lsan_1235 [Legionella santicrucis]|uniref:Coiled-coil protein n=1 Tax=Legionella santicrucis TaxID=45074 RepID=A0A0W0Z3U4_9GAMM|nr:hypothetical protein [Legionella santicrucis]KTD63802.1 hypothetical protein Lsan_1235 [Legionella santicrucis]
MPKSDRTTPTYNALFQEHSSPLVVLNRYNQTRPRVDTGQSCHVFAVVSSPSWETRATVNTQYANIGTDKLMERMEQQDRFELAERRKKQLDPQYIEKPFPNPTPEEIRQERMFNMGEILKLKTYETVLPVDKMFLCGGFRHDDIVPEHMWIEDHTNNRSYDTFINRGGIAVVDEVGMEGQSFQPGCEGSPFRGNEIGRVKVDGYTYGQLIAIASGSENKEKPFPDSIANTPQVLMAIETVKLVNEALKKVPGPGLSEAEEKILKKVEEEQLKKGTDNEIQQVIRNLTGADKINYESALAKLAEEARQQREVALAIVGTGFHPFVKLNQELNDAIKLEQIRTSTNFPEIIQLTINSLEELKKLENKKGTLPNNEFKEKFQQKIDEARIQIESAFAIREKQAFEFLTKKCNAIKPEQIAKSKTMTEVKECKKDLLEELRKLENQKNTLVKEEDKIVLQQKINEKRLKIEEIFTEKEKIGKTIEKVKTAAEKYLQWSSVNASGWRLTNLSYGSYGRDQADKLIKMIEQDKPMVEILKATHEIVNTSGINANSFTRYLHDELHADKEKLVGKDTLNEKFTNYKEKIQEEINEVEKTEEEYNQMRIN